MTLRILSILVLTHGAVYAAAPDPLAAAVPDSTSAFTVDGYEPDALPTYDLLGLARARVPRHLMPAFALQLGWVGGVLELAREDDAREVTATLVDHRLRADVVLALGLLDYFAVAIDLPVVLDQSGEDLDLLNRPAEAVSGAAFGDLRLAVRARIFHTGQTLAGFGLALGVDLHIPTGDTSAFMSYGGFVVRPLLALDWHDESGLGIVVNVGWRSVPETFAHNLVLDDGLSWGVGLDLPTPEPALHVLATVFGTAPFKSGRDPSDSTEAPRDDDRAMPIELVAAMQLDLGDVSFELGGGAGLSRGLGAPSARMFLEVAWSPEAAVVLDSDGDGLKDSADACPREPEDKDGNDDGDGCPESDDDRDGVPDLTDGSPDETGFGSCRNDPEDKDGFFDSDGCPEPDNDADRVLDVNDGAADASGFGACRDQPEDKDDNLDLDGCPEPDNDGDGVPDTIDGPVDKGFGACRDSPETINGYRDDDGCPDNAPKSVRVTTFKIEILEKIYFQYDRAIIKDESFALLDEVARVLNEAPELTLIQIEGHTDADGNAEYNSRLSQRRAEAVVAYLVERGRVDVKRLLPKGYGKSRPLVTGPAARSQQGRALNRRVEFVILEVNGQPHTTDEPVILDRPVPP